LQPGGWELPPDSFFQNNFNLLPQLVEITRERLRSSGARSLIDVYCGVGFFSLELADVVESYLGIEYDQRAVKAARNNARQRGRNNGEFLAGLTEELLDAVLRRSPPAGTVVLLDPPRTGCSPETLASLLAVRPQQIVYISCHPATLARDLGSLTAGGVYELVRLTPLDMFPQTQHVECVSDLRLVRRD
jgi:tRNA/tmRNA/rRNA uracil-C5-methylase (TrmA/RlmC/RlmD family)